MTRIVPSDKAWAYFVEHLPEIREVVDQFLPVDQWQSMLGPFGDKSNHTIQQFDAAVEQKDVESIVSIMNDAWGRAPEDRAVYRISGFIEMCNLLDGTVEDFFEPSEETEE